MIGTVRELRRAPKRRRQKHVTAEQTLTCTETETHDTGLDPWRVRVCRNGWYDRGSVTGGGGGSDLSDLSDGRSHLIGKGIRWTLLMRPDPAGLFC